MRYDAVNAMLLNEFLKQHRAFLEERRKVEKLQANVLRQEKDFEMVIAEQQQQIKALTASVKEQAAQIQKVSAQLEASKPAPRTVLNNQ